MNKGKYGDCVTLLQSLIRNKCVNDGTAESGQEARNVEALRAFLGRTATTAEVIEPAPGRANLVWRIPGTDRSAPSIALVAHLDVVPADASTWSKDPFAGSISDGAVWGRGTIDMLGLTAAMATVSREIASTRVNLRGDLVFAATADEEAGSRFGIGWLLENRPDLLATDYALTENGGIVLGAGTNDKSATAVTITVGEKGKAARRLAIRGRAGHGSTPWGSKNAAVLAGEVVARLGMAAGPATVDDYWRHFVTAAVSENQLANRLVDPATLNEALKDIGPLAGYAHALTHMTIAPTMLRAGVKTNVIPDGAEAYLDIRVLPGQTERTVAEQLRAALGDLADSVEIIGSEFVEASTSGIETPLYAAVARAIREHYPGAQLVPVIMPGASDAGRLRRAGVTCYGFGLFSRYFDMATFRQMFHGSNERIDIRSLELTLDALADTVQFFNEEARPTTRLGVAGDPTDVLVRRSNASSFKEQVGPVETNE